MSTAAALAEEESKEDEVKDFLWCLSWLEGMSDGLPLPRYVEILTSLMSAREEGGSVAWTRKAAEHAPAESAAALSWLVSNTSPLSPPHSGNDEVLPCRAMLVNPVAAHRVEAFQRLREAHGEASEVAFHGSRPENWSSILRTGLKNVSNTTKMEHGAAHGEGVYLTPNIRMAARYSGMTAVTTNDGQAYRRLDLAGHLPKPLDLRIIGVCEVVSLPEPALRKTLNNGIWVLRDDAAVALRALLIFDTQDKVALPTAEQVKRWLSQQMKAESESVCTRTIRMVPRPPLPLTLVRIPGWARVEESPAGPRRVVLYRVIPQGVPGRSAVNTTGVLRRYREFRALRDRVGSGPVARFPSRLDGACLFQGEEQKHERRRQALEIWLSQVVAAARRGLLRENLEPELRAFLGCWL
mmetsp:Transcript_15085/g.34333  ORF Transcript_15085/g.34333 Transcript_15085/m.34333 type:complete len:410 (+) Transcript_15085:82-1311(+)